MRIQIILVAGLIALASASPLGEKKQPSSLKVIDIPADLFPDAAENVEDVKLPVKDNDTPVPVASPEIPKEGKVVPEDAIINEENKDDVTTIQKNDKDGENENEDDKSGVFGFRLPTIVIIRRPAIFDDPFSFFPFSSFNRRPSFPALPAVPTENRRDEERPTVAASPSDQRPVSLGGGPGISDMMHNMRQQMDSLFSSLFAPNPNPNAGFFPNRQFFPRPFFPPVPIDSEEDSQDELLDFDKLPNNYKNSTSETKVVDGQVIQVNKTVHRISGNNSNGFFQFSVIKIRPSDSPMTEVEEKKQEESSNIPPAAIDLPEEKTPETELTTIKAQQESEMSNPSLNEVDQEEKEMPINTKYETDPGLIEESNAPVSSPLTQEVVYDFVPVKSMPLIQSTKGKSNPHDLSSDLRVNNLMANNENGRLTSLVDPDEIELIEV